MKTDFAKAIEAGEDVVGKEVVCVCDEEWTSFTKGDCCTVHAVGYGLISFNEDREACIEYANDFEFKHVLNGEEEYEAATKANRRYITLLTQADDKIKHLKEQLDGATEVNKQYEQQIQMLKDDLFNLQMENARLDLAAQRWQMFDCEVNRNIADKLLKKLADDAVGTN